MATVVERVCVSCEMLKPGDQFKGRRCTDCVRADARDRARASRAADPEKHRQALRDYRNREPDKHRAYAQAKHLTKLGITRVEYDALLASQGGRCAVCRRDQPGGKGRWHVDHDHKCCPGKKQCGECVRGLLCARCNMALGLLGDDPALVQAAVAYLTRPAVSFKVEVRDQEESWL